VSAQHYLIHIKNSKYASHLILSAGAPHYTTRRPALGTLVTLPVKSFVEYNVATVVAIEQNEWPKEWKYLVRVVTEGLPPLVLLTVLNTGSLNIQDTSIHISPMAIEIRRWRFILTNSNDRSE